jgi:hypothetical protein
VRTARRASLTLAAVTALSTRTAEAQSAPSDREISVRIQVISAALERDALPTARWRWGWSAALGSFAAGNVIRAIVAHAMGTTDAPAGWLAAAGSGAGLLNMLLVAPPAQYGAERFRAALARNELTRLEQLREGERLLRAAARNQDFTVSAASHALRIGVPIVMGMALEWGYALHTAAILNVAGGIAIGQFTVRTSPTAAIDAWARYTRRWPDAHGGPIARWSLPLESITVALRPGGVIVGATF